VLGNKGHTSKPKNLTLINRKNKKQNSTIMITGISADPSGEFNAVTSCVGPLAPGATCKVPVTFTPGAPGARVGTLSVVSNATNPLVKVPLKGTGKQGRIVISPRIRRFGGVMVGSTVHKPVVLKNRNPVAMHIGNIASGDPTQFQAAGCANTDIPAGGACTMDVTFTPNNTGRQRAALSIQDDAVGSPQSVKMLGRGK
jgi:cytochrome c